MKNILFTLTLITTSLFSYSQDYTTGIGLRGGPSNGLTVKHFISQKAALEGILTTRWGGFGLTGLYEINVPIKSVSRLYRKYKNRSCPTVAQVHRTSEPSRGRV